MNSSRALQRRNLAALAGFLGLWSLGGCTGTDGLDGLMGDDERTAEEATLLDSSDAIITRSTLQAAGIGALAGCGLGFAIGSGVTDCVFGMLGGAALGAGAGYVVGANNASAAQAEYDEQAIITVLTEQEQDLKQVEKNLHVVLADQGQRLATLNNELTAHEISEADYREQYNSMMEVRRQVAEDLAAEKENREEFAVQVLSLQEQGIDATPVAAKNAENLQKIERLIELAKQVEPSAA